MEEDEERWRMKAGSEDTEVCRGGVTGQEQNRWEESIRRTTDYSKNKSGWERSHLEDWTICCWVETSQSFGAGAWWEDELPGARSGRPWQKKKKNWISLSEPLRLAPKSESVSINSHVGLSSSAVGIHTLVFTANRILRDNCLLYWLNKHNAKLRACHFKYAVLMSKGVLVYGRHEG